MHPPSLPPAGLVIFQSRTIAGMAKQIRPMVHRKGSKAREIGDGGSDDGAPGSDSYAPHGGVVKGKVSGRGGWACVAASTVAAERAAARQPTAAHHLHTRSVVQLEFCFEVTLNNRLHSAAKQAAPSPPPSTSPLPAPPPLPPPAAVLPHLVLRLPAAHRLCHLAPAGVCHHPGPRLCAPLPLLVHQVPAGPRARAHATSHVPPLLWTHGERWGRGGACACCCRACCCCGAGAGLVETSAA